MSKAASVIRPIPGTFDIVTDAKNDPEAVIAFRRTSWDPKKYVVWKPGYPQGVQANEATRKAHNLPEGTIVCYLPYLEVCEEKGVLRPWAPSDQDFWATDWEEVEPGGN